MIAAVHFERRCLAAAVFLLPSVARAGAWARDPGSAYLRAGAGSFDGVSTNESFATAGGQFSSLAAEGYAEVGLGAGLEIDMSARWVETRTDFEGRAETNDGPEDLELLLAWAPVSGSDAVMFQLGSRVANYDRLEPDDVGLGVPERGPGGVDILAGGAFGHSFWPAPAWIDVDLLWRVRLGGASTAARLRTELGRTLVGPVAGAITVEMQPAFGRDIDQPSGAPAPIPGGWSVGAKLLSNVAHGFGLGADVAWMPEWLNDGPGYRLGLGVTWERP